jgi:hypothetical protein
VGEVWDPERNVVTEGILLDDGEHARLALWLHEHVCLSTLEASDESEERARKQSARRGYCDECRDFAADLLSGCPYIDKSRPDQMLLTDEGMSWQRRAAEVPDNKVPVAINERRRTLMGC